MSLIALQSIKKPWAHLLVHAEGEALDKILSVPAHFVTKTVAGKKCKTKAGLLDDWLPAKGYLVVVTDADQVLTKPDEEDDFETFVEILSEAGEAWSLKESDEATGDGLPFHAVLAVSDRHKRSRHNGHGAQTTEVRTGQGHKKKAPAVDNRLNPLTPGGYDGTSRSTRTGGSRHDGRRR